MSAEKPIVVVTRPAPMAAQTAEKLREMECEPLVAPLFDIELRPDVTLELDGVQALVFTSRNGVRAFAEKSERRDLPAWCVGAATAALAREEGFETVHEGPGNATRLAELLVEKLDPAAGALLHPSGAEIAVDLAEELRPHAIELRRVVVYDAMPREALGEEAAAALAAGEAAAVLFYSPRAAARFARLVSGAALAPDRTVALCLSDAVARPVAAMPWRQVRIAAEPNEAALLAGLKDVLAEPRPAATEPVMSSESADDETARPAPPPAHAEPVRRGAALRLFGWIVALLAMVVIAAGAVLTAPLWRDAAQKLLPPELVAVPDAQDERRIDALEGAIAQLRERLAESEQALADAELKLDAVAERTAGGDRLDEEFTAMGARLDGLERTMGDLFALVEDLPAGSGAGGGAAIGTVLELRERLDAFETDLAELRLVQQQAAGDLERLAGTAVVKPEDVEALRRELTQAVEAHEAARRELAGRIDGMTDRLDTVEAMDARLEETGGRIAALEDRLEALAEERGATGARLEDIAGDVGALREELAATRAAAGGLADLGARLDAIEQGLAAAQASDAEIVARLDEVDARTANIARAGRQAALALQLGQLQAALERGAPFTRELGAVKRLAGAEQTAVTEALAPLAGYAETGVASRRRLNQRFEALVPEILNAPQPAAEDGDWLATVSRTLGGLVTVRRIETDPAAGGVDAILARAEAALARDDLAAAVAALDELPPAEAAIAAPWIDTARARLAADTAMDDAGAALVADLAGER